MWLRAPSKSSLKHKLPMLLLDIVLESVPYHVEAFVVLMVRYDFLRGFLLIFELQKMLKPEVGPIDEPRLLGALKLLLLKSG